MEPIVKLFDIHLASDILSRELERDLVRLGFSRDAFIGGTTGVVHPQHFSCHPLTVSEMKDIWFKCCERLSKTTSEEFFGYGEAEVSPPGFRAVFDWKPFNSSLEVPFGTFEYRECPEGSYKDLDIHLTVELDSVDARVRGVLEQQMNFHYVDIRRSTGTVVRVYTVQPLGVKKIADFYWKFVDFIRGLGGLQGKIKLETTYAYKRFPTVAPVCPVIVGLPPTTRHGFKGADN